MLRKIRVILAALCFVAVTLLFLDFSGALHHWFGWLARIQFLPAVLALNFVVIVAMVLLTLLFGRIYCSVICPLGVFQDGVAHLSKKGRKRKYSYSKEIKWLRYGIWVLFVAALVAGLNSLVALLAPYSAWGRIVQSLLAPLYQWGNNLLATIAEHRDSYAFVTKEVWLKSLPTLLIALVTLVTVTILAWKNGRTYCNTLCPVGTTLSFFSRFAMFRPVIDASKCKVCHACERSCKAACIDIDGGMAIDYSRCVDCFNCLDSCKFGALTYRFAYGRNAQPQDKVESSKPAAGFGEPQPQQSEDGLRQNQTPDSARQGQDAGPVPETDAGRRAFLVGSAVALTGMSLKAQEKAASDTTSIEKEIEGGLADIIDKKAPARSVPITPFGSRSVEMFYQHCTACQLCVTVCPNDVLRPSTSLKHLMQPEMSFERGYCRPECVKCSEVCPTGAILKITPEEKTEWKIGTASINYELCIVANGEVDECGNCARHCPVGAIKLVRQNPDDNHSVRIPSVEEEACIGCGACENLCPSRPVSAITVNGYKIHHKEEIA